MAAVWFCLRAEMRSRWRTWLALAVLAGSAGGLVLAVAAAARRTDSAIVRHRVATESMDVWVGRGDYFGLDLDFDRVARLPQVAQVARSVDLAFWGRTESGRPVTNDEVELGVSTDGSDPAQNHPKVLAGRVPDPAAADEIFVGHRAAEYYDLHVGSTLRARFSTPRELARSAATGERNVQADPETAGTGPLVTLRVVGVRVDAQSEDGLMYITMSPAFYETYGRKVGVWLELLGVRLKHGDADLPAFRAGVERIGGGNPVELYPKATIQAKLVSSVHVQAQALWVLAVLGGLAALLLVGQALARQTALESSEHPLLRSLGMTRRQLFAFGVARVGPVALVAGALAAAVAVVLSPFAPIGAARTAEPDPGIHLDPLVIGAGSAATAALVLLAAVVPAWRAAHARVEPVPPRSSPVVEFLRRAGLPPSGAAGVRMALDRGRGRTAVPVGSTLVAVVVGVAAVAAALTITASADRLLGTPRLYGHNWDAVIGNGSEPRYSERFVARLRADRSIAQLAGGTVREARLEGRPTGVLAISAIRGSVSPTVLEGRAPTASSEILLGAKTARLLGAEIGDEVEGRIGDRASPFHVVGRGVLPEVAAAGVTTTALGQGVAMTFEGLRRLDPRAPRNIFLVGVAGAANRVTTLARLERDAAAAVPQRPAEVGNWGRVSGFPYLVAALVAAAAAAALAHALVTSVRRRRRDLAILKTLGFERHDVRAAVAWQATTIAAIGLLAGLPLGIGIGRFAWNLFAGELGVVPDAVAPLWPGLLIIPATLLLANLVALLPGRIAARTSAPLVLRAE